MNFKNTQIKPRTLLSRETHKIEITDVTPADAKKLTWLIYHLYAVEFGANAKVEIVITGNNFLMFDNWETQDDYQRFLKGYALAMFVNGVDFEKTYLNWEPGPASFPR